MVVAYANAALVKVAFNNPNKFPKAEDFLKEKSRRSFKTSSEQREFLSRLAKKAD